MERTIKLNYQRKFFEEIYFRDNNEHYWKSPSLGRTPRYLIVFALLSIIVVSFVQLSTPAEKPTPVENGMMGVVLVGLVMTVSSYVRKATVISKWKKSIVVYLDDLEKHSQYQLIIRDENLTLLKDDLQTTTKWSGFSKVEATPEYIHLVGVESYFFPRKSLSASDFSFLQELLPKKIS